MIDLEIKRMESYFVSVSNFTEFTTAPTLMPVAWFQQVNDWML